MINKNNETLYKPLIFDLIFKYIFGYEKNIRFTEYLLEILLKKEPNYFRGKIKIMDSYNLDKKYIYEKGKELDVNILLSDNSMVNLEAYSSYFGNYAKRKSLMYESASCSNMLNVGDKISDNNVKKVKQYNFVKGFHLPFQEYGLMGINEPYDELLSDEFRLNVFDIDQYKLINYNNDRRLNELLEFMNAKTKEEALAILKKYKRKELNDMNSEMGNFFNHDAWMIEAFSKERWADALKEDAIEHAKNEAIIKTTKNMLSMNMKIKDISKVTGLTEDEIKKLR